MDEQILKMIFRIVTPWKKNYYDDKSEINNAYTTGWNACLKEIAKNKNKLIKNLPKYIQTYEKL